MKRTLAILLAMLLVLSSVCVAAAEADPITFDFLTWSYASVSDGNLNYNEGNKVTEYMEEKTGIKINFTQLPATDPAVKLNTIIAGGDYPDALFDVRDITNATILEWADEGVILPLDELIAEYMPNFSAVLEEREDIRMAVTAPDGHIYSLPRTDGGIHMTVNNKIFVYTAWYEAYLNAGNPEVVTTEDYKNMLTFFKENDMNGNGDAADEIPLTGASDKVIEALMNPFTLMGSADTATLYKEDGKVVAPYIQDGYREGLAYIHGLYEAGLIDGELFSQDSSQIKALINRELENDRIAGGFCHMWTGNYVNTGIMPYRAYTAIGPLAGPDGTQQTAYNLNDVRAVSSVIFSTCEHPEELAAYLDYFYSYEGTMLMAYGLEGVSWEWSDIPSISGEAKSVRRLVTGNEVYYNNLSWEANSPCYRTPEVKYIETSEEGGSGIELYETSMLYMPYADESKAISPLLWQTEDQTEERTLFEAQIEAYVDECTAAFITGKMSLENDWDQYIQTLENMGVQDYLTLMQEIVDANS